MKKTSLQTQLILCVIVASALTAWSEERKAQPSPASPAPQPVALSLAPPAMPGPEVFPVLYGKNHKVLGTNLEYSATYGLRVVFKDVNSSRRVAFDVDQLHPDVLAQLEIDPATQREIHARQEAAWARVIASDLAMAREQQAAAEQRRRETLWASRTVRLEVQNGTGTPADSPRTPASQASDRWLLATPSR